MNNEQKSIETKKYHYAIVITIAILFLIFLRLQAIERDNKTKENQIETGLN